MRGATADERKKGICTIFKKFDTNGDGTLDAEEFASVLRGIGIDADADIHDVVQAADANRDNRVNYEEFMAWVFSEDAIKKDLGLDGLTLTICRAWNVPDKDRWGGSDPFIVIDVLDKDGACLETVSSRVVPDSEDEVNPVWDQKMLFSTAPTWDLDSTSIKITLNDKDTFSSEWIGSCTASLKHLIERPVQKYLLSDADGQALLGTPSPYWPCEVQLSVDPSTLPLVWPRPEEPEPYDADTYPMHAFLMTRGTRGDVQPFVALARGMAEQHGWLVTICTELRWRDFVLSKSQVSRGKIRFRPSGGDTQARMGSWVAKEALSSNSELVQMAILANSESEFFCSLPVFVSHIQKMESEPKPVDLVVFGLTVAGAACIISEYCKKPIAGFFLQPSCIPSEDEAWKAVIPISTHSASLFDHIESQFFSSQGSLEMLKSFAEHNPFAKWSIGKMRSEFGLEDADTWETLRSFNVPIGIPMREGTFVRPSDWWDTIHLSDFIFLRTGGGGDKPASLGEPLDGFIAGAQEAGAKLGLMTFSSMPVPRATMLACATKMVEECVHNLRLVYVGHRQEDEVPEELLAKASALTEEGRFLEMGRADFGVLFGHMDCFMVHGGLGTTVEALRRKKPCVVTGPLLLDQRFWGSVVHQKGVGPEPVHISRFEDECVGFVNGALDPEDPQGWQAACAEQDWGDGADDGVAANVEWFRQMMEDGLQPIAR